MDAMRQLEYAALRATIRERGTARMITFFVTLLGWAALDLAVVAAGTPAVGPLLPLLVLAAGFEAVFQMHLGVERVGRYLQVAYEEFAGADTTVTGAGNQRKAGWETVAMAYGKAYPGAGSDALFAMLFLLAALANLLSALPFWRMPALFAALAVAHALFVVRMRVARMRAGRQRAEDLARFRELLA